MSNINIEGSHRIVQETITKLGQLMIENASLMASVCKTENFAVLDWESLREGIDAHFDDVFALLGLVDELELSDEGTIMADEYDEPDYYDDEVA